MREKKWVCGKCGKKFGVPNFIGGPIEWAEGVGLVRRKATCPECGSFDIRNEV